MTRKVRTKMEMKGEEVENGERKVSEGAEQIDR